MVHQTLGVEQMAFADCSDDVNFDGLIESQANSVCVFGEELEVFSLVLAG